MPVHHLTEPSSRRILNDDQNHFGEGGLTFACDNAHINRSGPKMSSYNGLYYEPSSLLHKQHQNCAAWKPAGPGPLI